jgi:hypothetical protein
VKVRPGWTKSPIKLFNARTLSAVAAREVDAEIETVQILEEAEDSMLLAIGQRLRIRVRACATVLLGRLCGAMALGADADYGITVQSRM